MARKKKDEAEDLVFPNREATMRDVARFSHWAGIDFQIALRPKPPKKPRKRVDSKKPRT